MVSTVFSKKINYNQRSISIGPAGDVHDIWKVAVWNEGGLNSKA